MSYVLAAGALLATWVVFRLERHARQQSAVGAARAVLNAALHGMVKGFGDQRGWGDIYFATRYTPAVLAEQASEAHRVVLAEQRFSQVFEVPTEPVAAVATAVYPTDLLLERTRFAANTALWRLRVFNQLVRLQTTFNSQHTAEVVNPETPAERREELAAASASIAVMLHGNGIGEAAAPNGWYGLFKETLEENVRHLDGLRGFSCSRYFRDPLALVDLVAIGVFAAAVFYAA